MCDVRKRECVKTEVFKMCRCAHKACAWKWHHQEQVGAWVCNFGTPNTPQATCPHKCEASVLPLQKQVPQSNSHAQRTWCLLTLLLAMSRKVTDTRPSFHSRVAGCRYLQRVHVCVCVSVCVCVCGGCRVAAW